MFDAQSLVFAPPASPSTLEIAAQPSQDQVGADVIGGILSQIPAWTNSWVNQQLEKTYGEVDAVGGGQQPAPGQPNAGGAGGEEPGTLGAGGFAIGGTAIVAAVVVGGFVYWWSHNIAWTLIAGVLAAVLSGWMVG
jgi:hypothetical protein